MDNQRKLQQRAETMRQLDISITTVIRLEKQGVLTPVKLSGRLGRTFHAIDEVEALIASYRKTGEDV